MLKLLQYYLRFQNARGSLGGMPGWAKFLLLIVALPGILGILLAVLVFCVSLLALLLLAAPVYRLLNAITGGGRQEEEIVREPTDFVDVEMTESETESPIPTTFVTQPSAEPQRPRRQIDVRIVE